MQHNKPRNTHDYKKENQTKTKKNRKKKNKTQKHKQTQLNPPKEKKNLPQIIVKTSFSSKKHCLSCGICKNYSSNCFIPTPIPENTFHGTNTWNIWTLDISEFHFFF